MNLKFFVLFFDECFLIEGGWTYFKLFCLIKLGDFINCPLFKDQNWIFSLNGLAEEAKCHILGNLILVGNLTILSFSVDTLILFVNLIGNLTPEVVSPTLLQAESRVRKTSQAWLDGKFLHVTIKMWLKIAIFCKVFEHSGKFPKTLSFYEH